MKKIPDTNGMYSATADGKIYSHHRNKTTEKVQVKDKNGYMRISMYYDGKKFSPTVHSLIIKTFVGSKPFEKANINHKDGNKENNSVGNLEYCTYKENHNHAITMGLRSPQGEGNGRSVLTDEQVVDMRSRFDSGRSLAMLARDYNISTSQCIRLCYREQRRYI